VAADRMAKPGLSATNGSSRVSSAEGTPSRSFPTALPARRLVSLEVMVVDTERHDLITARRFIVSRCSKRRATAPAFGCSRELDRDLSGTVQQGLAAARL
jgi:hypothetical protein